ncbi:hypothetical protein GQ44DRAFT_725220 [Phaeosphaeriaceae sp. PMI808]|nr:hypothetical protein GQ44DRAFT_725220 [Phaeosphaeriaceae sp. PMI808]
MSLLASVPASSSHCSDSLKQRRTNNVNDVQPKQSASQFGSETPLVLNKRNTFSPPASHVSLSPKRSSSLTRETPIILRTCWGVDFSFIPQNLLTDFNGSDTQSAEELSTMVVPERVRTPSPSPPKTYLTRQSSSQSQSINPLYLSTIPAPTLTDSTRRKPTDRKTDYVLSYSHRDSNISALYKRLDTANNREIGHTFDTFTKRTALFSGFEVKPASGIAASLRKKQGTRANFRRRVFHRFMDELAQSGRLQRHFTQNIDCLGALSQFGSL